MLVDLAQGFQYVPAFLGKLRRHLDEFPSSMGDTIRHHSLEFLRQIACEPVTHLNRRSQLLGPLGQNVRQIFPGMLAPGKEQGISLPCPRGYDP